MLIRDHTEGWASWHTDMIFSFQVYHAFYKNIAVWMLKEQQPQKTEEKYHVPTAYQAPF